MGKLVKTVLPIAISIAVPFALPVIAPALAASPLITGAISGGLSSLAGGGNPLLGALTGGALGGASSLFGSASGSVFGDSALGATGASGGGLSTFSLDPTALSGGTVAPTAAGAIAPSLTGATTAVGDLYTGSLSGLGGAAGSIGPAATAGLSTAAGTGSGVVSTPAFDVGSAPVAGAPQAVPTSGGEGSFLSSPLAKQIGQAGIKLLGGALSAEDETSPYRNIGDQQLALAQQEADLNKKYSDRRFQEALKLVGEGESIDTEGAARRAGESALVRGERIARGVGGDDRRSDALRRKISVASSGFVPSAAATAREQAQRSRNSTISTGVGLIPRSFTGGRGFGSAGTAYALADAEERRNAGDISGLFSPFFQSSNDPDRDDTFAGFAV